MQYAGIPMEIWSMILSSCTPKSYTNLMRCIPGLNSYNRNTPAFPMRKICLGLKDFPDLCIYKIISKSDMNKQLRDPRGKIIKRSRIYLKIYEAIPAHMQTVYLCRGEWNYNNEATKCGVKKIHAYFTYKSAADASKKFDNHELINCRISRYLMQNIYYTAYHIIPFN
jgi:hypothetical protein